MTEPIAIIFLTYARTNYALRAIRAAREHLRYPELVWYLADDGSSPDHLQAVRSELNGSPGIGWHTLPNGTYGANANQAYQAVKDQAQLTLWLEDDWELKGDLDLAPYADLLLAEPSIGMVRLGYLNLHIQGQVFGQNGRLYWKLDRHANPYTFTGHPSLRHRRFMDSYGPYPEGLKPGETELAFALQYRTRTGPDIVWPAALGEGHLFGHIGTIQSYE